jgi:hypothetical protein
LRRAIRSVWPRHALLVTSAFALFLVGCRHGGAHADTLLTIRNDSAQVVTVRWRSAGLLGPSSLDVVDAGGERIHGIDAGIYTVSVDGPDRTMRMTIASSSGDPDTALLVVNWDLSLTLR